ncbi:MAG: hypothetical protein U0821_14140 [Chloroflexota bacterium]
MSEPSILESMPTDLAERADWLNDIMLDRAPRWPGMLPNERQVDYLISVVRHSEPAHRQREVSDAARELLARWIIENRGWESPDLDRLHEILGVLESLPGSGTTASVLYDLTRLSVLDATRDGVSLRRQAFRALALADPPPGWRRENLIDEWRALVGDPHITVAAFAGLRSLDLLAAIAELPRFLLVAEEAGITPSGSLNVLCQMVERDDDAIEPLRSALASLPQERASRLKNVLQQSLGADWRYPKVWAVASTQTSRSGIGTGTNNIRESQAPAQRWTPLETPTPTLDQHEKLGHKPRERPPLPTHGLLIPVAA